MAHASMRVRALARRYGGSCTKGSAAGMKFLRSLACVRACVRVHARACFVTYGDYDEDDEEGVEDRDDLLTEMDRWIDVGEG